jgi:PIN domain nuclease of toxin-antitoxin system
MQLLLDTNVLIALSRDEVDKLDRQVATIVAATVSQSFASVAALWEIAIKTRLGKLDPARPLGELPDHFESLGLSLLDIDRHHVLADLDPEPETRDPFDRLLLAQCQVEGMRLVTMDRALADHPLVWREA